MRPQCGANQKALYSAFFSERQRGFKIYKHLKYSKYIKIVTVPINVRLEASR